MRTLQRWFDDIYFHLEFGFVSILYFIVVFFHWINPFKKGDE